MRDPYYLYGPQMIEAMWKKPGKMSAMMIHYLLYVCFYLRTEYMFLNRYHNLLYKSITPNCKITLPVLRQHYNISKSVDDFILTGTSARIRVQRLLNFLLVSLDNEKDYMKFCVVINSISVLSDLPYRIITGN